MSNGFICWMSTYKSDDFCILTQSMKMTKYIHLIDLKYDMLNIAKQWEDDKLVKLVVLNMS